MACVTNLVVFFLCYRSSNSLRLVDVQTCSKFGRKQTLSSWFMYDPMKCPETPGGERDVVRLRNPTEDKRA